MNAYDRDLIDITRPIQTEIGLFEERLATALTSEIPLVQQVARYLVGIKGKRLRPILSILSAQAVGRMSDKVLDAAVGIELIQTATLIHDDVVDFSDMRRGAPSLNALWGNQASVLMGDFLFARALTILVGIGSQEVMRAASRATERIIEGEMLAIERDIKDDLTDESSYFEMIRKKTAAFLAMACEIGAILGNGKLAEVGLMAGFGEDLGLAFQITDDLLDFIGDAALLGKPVGSDVKVGKITLPLIWALNRCSDGEHRRTLEKIEQGVDGEADWQEIQTFVHRYDGIGYARRRAHECADRAVSYLRRLPDSAARGSLEHVVAYAVGRER